MWPLLSVDFSWHINISTHTSRVGCDTTATPVEVSTMYFYSHIPCGMWQIAEAVNDEPVNFYSHIPCGMWLWRRLDHTRGFWEFLLTHPVWDVTNQLWGTLKRLRISTHTSRVGCDNKITVSYVLLFAFLLTHPVWDVTITNQSGFNWLDISTHTSRVGCDQFGNDARNAINDFYSHIPCGMWRKAALELYYDKTISTHTSRVGCDQTRVRQKHANPEFLLTHPVWDVTARQTLTTQTTQISTHTSRVGCDTQPVPGTCAAGFLLTHPVWDVTWIAYIGRSNDEFLLTHPVWDVTTNLYAFICSSVFLLTHPVWDVTSSRKNIPPFLNFYSHIPCGMWLTPSTNARISRTFLLTHPVWDVTKKQWDNQRIV